MKTMEEAYSWEPCILKHPAGWDVGFAHATDDVGFKPNHGAFIKCTSDDGEVRYFKTTKELGDYAGRAPKRVGEAIRRGFKLSGKYTLERVFNA